MYAIENNTIGAIQSFVVGKGEVHPPLDIFTGVITLQDFKPFDRLAESPTINECVPVLPIHTFDGLELTLRDDISDSVGKTHMGKQLA